MNYICHKRIFVRKWAGSAAAMIDFKGIHENCIRRGITPMILNPQLEDNFKVQSLFDQYEMEPYMRRRAYRKALAAIP